MLTLLGIQTMEEDPAWRNRELDRLLVQVGEGDREALAQVYHRARASVYALALSLLKNAHEAEDVTQDTFVKVWESAPGYRAQGSPMAWMLTIARNLSRMRLRQGGRQVGLEEEEWNAIPADAPAVSPEDRQVLQTALAALGEEERQIILLHAVTGLKHREIAELMELPLATVLSKYHRGLKKMRAQLEGDETP